MSIITEALKKAQKEKPAGDPPPATRIEESFLESFPKKNVTAQRTVSGSLPYVLFGGALTVLVMVFFVVANNSNSFIPKDNAASVAAFVDQAKPLQSVPEPASSAKDTRPVFQPSRQTAKQEQYKPEPELSGIMYTPTRPQAVINGQPVFEGENVDGYTVVKIYPDRVKLSLNGVETEVKLK
jgi:cytoskeletal protein RodZ